jgi:8-oxo-dGTP pyrophosphatase MutT (NUDIX family)
VNEARAHSLTERLTAAERERRWPNMRPRDAATLIIIDRVAREPKLLMGRRHPGHVFMPGKFVFPGGRIEAGDRSMVAAGTLHPRAEAALHARVVRPSAQLGRALALAAIRETFEETGLLVGTKDYGPPDGAPAGPWTAFREHGVFPDLEAMHVIARAITPPNRPRRFDTRFFAVDRMAVAAQVDGITGPDAELIELAWVTLANARTLDLPSITQVILEELEDRLKAGFAHELPVPFYYERRGRFVREVL